MKRPTIFHDHILGQAPHLKDLLLDAEAGLLSPDQFRDFFIHDGFYQFSLMQAVRLLMVYRGYGQHVFMVGPQFRDMLCRTSVKGVPVDALQLPYPAFYIATPDCEWELWGGETGFHKLTGVLVGLEVNEAGMNLVFFLWGEENHKARVIGDDASFWFTIAMSEALSANEGGKLDLEGYVRMVLQDPGRDSSDFVEINDSAPPNARDFMVTLPDNGFVRDKITDTAANVVRMVSNLIVYLQSVGASRPTYQETLERQQQVERLSEAHITWLGKDIETSPRGPRGPSSKALQHWVRGHWWPRLDNRDAIGRHGIHWRQPYERNVDSDEAMPSREYHMDEE